MKDIFVKGRDILQKLEIDDIYYFTKKDRKVIAVTKEGSFRIDTSLYYINEVLGNNPNFLRCHKSFIVNLKKINTIIKFNNKTYNINFKGIKELAYITQRNLKILADKVSII